MIRFLENHKNVNRVKLKVKDEMLPKKPKNNYQAIIKFSTWKNKTHIIFNNQKCTCKKKIIPLRSQEESKK
jgi:hypothetical protein